MGNRTRLRATTPLLVVSDLPRSIEFYCEKLGFSEPNVHGDPPCFAMLQRDGFDLMLSLATPSTPVRPNGPSGTWDIYLTIVEVAAEIAALEALGVRLERGPTDTFYEMREIEILDPDAYRLCLAQDISRGPWPGTIFYEGVLDLGARSLRLVLKLAQAEGRTVGCLDSPDQGATNLPIDHVVREGSTLRFEMSGIGASYAGRFGADEAELSGHWSQGGLEWPLVLRRS